MTIIGVCDAQTASFRSTASRAAADLEFGAWTAARRKLLPQASIRRHLDWSDAPIQAARGNSRPRSSCRSTAAEHARCRPEIARRKSVGAIGRRASVVTVEMSSPQPTARCASCIAGRAAPPVPRTRAAIPTTAGRGAMACRMSSSTRGRSFGGMGGSARFAASKLQRVFKESARRTRRRWITSSPCQTAARTHRATRRQRAGSATTEKQMAHQ